MSAAAGLPFGRERMPLPAEPFRLDPVVPPPAPRPRTSEERIREGLARPVGSPSVEDVLEGARRVLVVISDATRATGAARFLPALLGAVDRTGRPEVRFIVASGIHRRPTDGEIEEIVGPELAGRYEVIRHDPDDEDGLVDVGRTRAGTTVRVHAAVETSDRLVLTGAVGFHYYAGFSGGRKAVVPGLAARDTVTSNHLRALRRDGSRHPAARAGRLAGNPVHADMAEGAARTKPDLLVNSVMGEDGTVERLFVGHWRRAHESACRFVRARRLVRVAPRDLVVASAGGWPLDINVIQSHKAFEATMPALRPGGVFVLVASCGEGPGHEEFVPWFRHATEEDLVRALRANFQVYGQTALSWRRKAGSCRLILVSRLDPGLVRRLGAEPAADLNEAFRLARDRLRGDARGWVFPHAARLCVEAGSGGDG